MIQLASPVNKPITTPYGKEGKHWKLGRHTGVDYACPVGTPVFAVTDCVVVEAGDTVSWGSAYGKAIIIENTELKRRALYAHLSKIDVKKGDRVKGGTQIGLSGNTGNSTGPHLHYEERELPKVKYGDDKPPVLIHIKLGDSPTPATQPGSANATNTSVISKKYPGKPVKPGDSGDAVKALQLALNVPVTGSYDNTLKDKVVAFQKSNKALGTPDGIVGPKSWAAIVK